MTDTKEVAGKEVKVVLNPKNNDDISDCLIKITKKTEVTDDNDIKNYKITYTIESLSLTDSKCPTKYGSVS